MRPGLLLTTLLMLLSFAAYSSSAKMKALMNVNPVLKPGDAGYINPELITSGQGHILSDIFYKVFEPFKGAKESAVKMPLVIMLHGCGQSGQSFVESTKIFAQAQKNKFMIVAPEQSRMRNFFGCWNFYRASSRDGYRASEMDDILKIIEKVKKEFPVDADRVYIAGISAGAGMANNIAITNPHLVKGIAVSAAPSYGYNPDSRTLNWMMFNVMGMDKDPTPDNPMMKPQDSDPYTKRELEELTKEKFGMRSEGEEPKLKNVLVFHGEKDPMVDSNFLDVTEKQYRNAFGIDDKEISSVKKRVTTTNNKGSYRVSTTEFSKGSTVESYMIENMWHSWGGGDGRTFTDPNYIDQTMIMLERFGLNTPSIPTKESPCTELLLPFFSGK